MQMQFDLPLPLNWWWLLQFACTCFAVQAHLFAAIHRLPPIALPHSHAPKCTVQRSSKSVTCCYCIQKWANRFWFDCQRVWPRHAWDRPNSDHHCLVKSVHKWWVVQRPWHGWVCIVRSLSMPRCDPNCRKPCKEQWGEMQCPAHSTIGYTR